MKVNFKDKLTEDETIIILMDYLKGDGWKVESYCLGQTRGCDIVASKDGTKFYIEVKGAKAHDQSPTKTREYFDKGQIKSHLGRAIVKILDDKYNMADSKFAIAHPEDPQIRKAIGHLVPFLKQLEITHFWVASNGNIVTD